MSCSRTQCSDAGEAQMNRQPLGLKSNTLPQPLHSQSFTFESIVFSFQSMKPSLKQIMFGTILLEDAYLFLELGIFFFLVFLIFHGHE